MSPPSVISEAIARAINAASGNRPLVVLANLSGFDGSPESLSKWQLEFGAEIGRAVVNFRGPIVFCVISRYHGGAFVVFSNALHDNMEVVALEGSHASVIGGATSSTSSSSTTSKGGLLATALSTSSTTLEVAFPEQLDNPTRSHSKLVSQTYTNTGSGIIGGHDVL